MRPVAGKRDPTEERDKRRKDFTALTKDFATKDFAITRAGYPWEKDLWCLPEGAK